MYEYLRMFEVDRRNQIFIDISAEVRIFKLSVIGPQRVFLDALFSKSGSIGLKFSHDF